MSADSGLIAAHPATHRVEPIERETMRRVIWRFLPILMLGYFCASLDRANVGMAATTMKSALGFSNTQFGFGAGIFFWGYSSGDTFWPKCRST